MFLPGDITARILDGARGVAQMIAWPNEVVLQQTAHECSHAGCNTDADR